jgi:hypothetical protein
MQRRKSATQVTLICYNFKGQVVRKIMVYHCDNHSQPELVFVFHPTRSGKLKGQVLQTRPANVWEERLGCMACRLRQTEPFLWDLGKEYKWSWKAVEQSFASWAARNKITLSTLNGGVLDIPKMVTDYSHLTPAQLPSHVERPLSDDEL